MEEFVDKLKEAQAVKDRWQMILNLEKPMVKKSDIPKVYLPSWIKYFAKQPRALIGQGEYSQLYRAMITEGVLNDNF